MKDWAVYTARLPDEDDPDGEFEALPLSEVQRPEDKIVKSFLGGPERRWLRHEGGGEARIVAAETEEDAIAQVRKILQKT